jgi:hypothetical protein
VEGVLEGDGLRALADGLSLCVCLWLVVGDKKWRQHTSSQHALQQSVAELLAVHAGWLLAAACGRCSG